MVNGGGGGGELNSRDEGKSATSLMITEQPEGLWSNRVDRRIQLGNQVRNSVQRSSDCSGGWWWWWGELNSRNLEKSAPTLRITPQPEGLWSDGVDRRIQRAKQIGNGIQRSSHCSCDDWGRHTNLQYVSERVSKRGRMMLNGYLEAMTSRTRRRLVIYVNVHTANFLLRWQSTRNQTI